MKETIKIIAGPCVVESLSMLDEIASELKEAIRPFDIDFYYKASYKKANRTSHSSFSGIGDEKALGYIKQIGEKYSFKTITDVHSVEEVEMAQQFVDVLQIPAFLCRQTELIQKAASTGKIINIKKGQFAGPEVMLKAAQKAKMAGGADIWITERGTSFGYHDLIVDLRSIVFLKQHAYSVIYDATHSVQQPSIGEQSGGLRQFTEPLARAAIVSGADGIFFETHPSPEKALSDSATQLALADAKSFIKMLVDLYEFS